MPSCGRGHLALDGFDERRHGRLRVGRYGHIDPGVAKEILIISFDVEIADSDADQFGARLRDRMRSAVDLIVESVHVLQKSATSRPRITSASAINVRLRAVWLRG